MLQDILGSNLLEKIMKYERTLVIFKPDVIQRQIMGEIIERFERKGFKIVGMKMIWPTAELIGKHYEDNQEYFKEVGDKTIKSARERGEKLFSNDPIEIGRRIRQWNMLYMSCGPVFAIVLEGPHIIEAVRKMLGSTNPLNADIGTIRSDYSPDSYFLANLQGRTTRTMVHASDSIESANREIPLWFKKSELYDYETAIEKVLFDVGWSGN